MAEEVKISLNDLLQEAEEFLETAKTSPDFDFKCHFYRDAAIRTFYKEDLSQCLPDPELVRKMGGGDEFDTDVFMDEFYDHEKILFEYRKKKSQNVPTYLGFVGAGRYKYHYFEPDGKFKGYSFGVLLARALAKKVGIKNEAAVNQIKLFAEGSGKYALKFDDETKSTYKTTEPSSSPGSPILVSDSPSPEPSPVGPQSTAGPPKQTGGMLGARRSIVVPKPFRESVPILPEEDEVTMDELKRISITLMDIDEDTFLKTDDLFNFSVSYRNEDGVVYDLKLVDKEYGFLLPKGIIGRGFMGVVGVYTLPNNKLVALKLERSEHPSKFTLDAFDTRCSIQSPVISVTPLNRKGPNDFSAKIFWYGAEKSDNSRRIERYNIAYVMPTQSGDGNALFKLLVDQLDAKVITKEEFVNVLVQLYADMAKQTFCVLREDVTIRDIKPDNFLYRRTGERQVRLMFTDWGLWRAANQYVWNPPLDVDKFEADGTYSLIPLLRIITMVLTENLSDEAKRAAAAVIGDASLKDETAKAAQRLNDACSESDPDYAAVVAGQISKFPLAAYFVCDVLDKYDSEVELTPNGQIRFLQQGSAAPGAPAGKKKPGGEPQSASSSESSRRSLSPETLPLSPTSSEASSGTADLPTVLVVRKASPLRLCVVSPAAGTADNPVVLN